MSNSKRRPATTSHGRFASWAIDLCARAGGCAGTTCGFFAAKSRCSLHQHERHRSGISTAAHCGTKNLPERRDLFVSQFCGRYICEREYFFGHHRRVSLEGEQRVAENRRSILAGIFLKKLGNR